MYHYIPLTGISSTLDDDIFTSFAPSEHFQPDDLPLLTSFEARSAFIADHSQD